MAKLDKAVYNYLDYELSHYTVYKKELAQLRAQIMEQSPLPPDGLPHGNTRSSPTEQKVIQMQTSMGILLLERTVQAVEKTLGMLSEEHRKVFYAFYGNGKKTRHEVCSELHISYETFNRRRRDIRERFGYEMGILRMDE